ncbi:SDR family NAD(P)-dependent oxidoreductase [Yonghaparkia sp. Root332]|uniref:SDR family NAD(P)-dependent oxidoreductase n=1 Tax=Yonghaparkia sp. Root332 TaxID=1736516 RepID=UPI0006F386FA|nr:SDR family NAD(P)-dependent oxidoreductase [Yonghaparkia sp. Root332]KQV24484.1 hypothetical protein ASC54_08000 [Yonghaparkia sp. Root332]
MTAPARNLLPALGPRLDGTTALITGGTDGVGAALALQLRDRGAHVIVIGRSAEKARALIDRSDAASSSGSLTARTVDFSLMRSVEQAVDALADDIDRIDILVQGVGVFLSHVEHTAEGVELDFAVSYLARFVLLERAATRGLIGPGTRLLSLAATSPTTPGFARVEFDDLDAVTARTGFRGHAAAQTANDLLVAAASARYGVAAMGYGPGNVRTGILRAQPWWFRTLVGLFPKREPQAVAEQLVSLLTDASWSSETAGWAGRRGRFEIAPFIADERRQRDLVAASEELHRRALAAPIPAPGSTQF